MPIPYVKQTWIDGLAGGTPISAARLAYIEDGIENATVEDGAYVQVVAAPTGVRVTDEANLQAAIDALPSPEGGRLVLAPGGGTYIAEQLTAANLEYLEVDGQNAMIKLPDDDGLGGNGQILVMTDVIKFKCSSTRFHANRAGSKSSVVHQPLVLFTTTVATATRKDFTVDLDHCMFDEAPGGWGQFRVAMYEVAGDTYPAFERISIRNHTSHSHGIYGAISVRGPGKLIEIDNLHVQNDGQYGLVAVGDPVLGSTAKPLGISCDITFDHLIETVKISNYKCYRTQGPLFTQMVKNVVMDGCVVEEISTNPFWDTAPIPFTADAVTDVLTTAVPSIPGGAIESKNYGNNSIVKVTSTGTPPAPLVNGQMYYVRDATASTIKLRLQSSGSAINITDAGTGTHSLEWMGYTYDAGIKGDDNKHSATNPSTHTYRNVQFIRSSPHTSRNAVQWVWTIHVNAIARVILQDCSFDSKLDIGQGTPNHGHKMIRVEFTPSHLANIDSSIASYANLGAVELVDDCYFPSNTSWQNGFDLTIQNSRFAQGVVHSFPAGTKTVVRYLANTFNLQDLITQRVEITPPATGDTATVIMRGNRPKTGGTQQTQLRISTSGDLAGLSIEEHDNWLGTDTGGASRTTDPTIRWTGRGNRLGRRGRSEFPSTLTNSATPSVEGDSVWKTDGSTPITNLLNGIENEVKTIYVASGHQINNTATIVLRGATNISGPAVVQLFLFGGVWIDIAASAAASAVVRTQIDVLGAGSGSWAKPTWAVTVDAIACGSGGGGGSGAKGPTGNVRCGGGGGSGGGLSWGVFNATDLLTTETYGITAGGAGGAAQTINGTAGNAGTAGGVSYLGATSATAKIVAAGGLAGAGGTTGASSGTGTGGNAARGTWTSGVGGTASTTGGVGGAGAESGSLSTNTGGAGGGGAGGGITTGNVAAAGGTGGRSSTRASQTLPAGGAVDSAGTPGGSIAPNSTVPGQGGGGGGASTTGNGGVGGAGARGGGGGGGGAATDSVGDSGAGGAGGDGFIILVSRG